MRADAYHTAATQPVAGKTEAIKPLADGHKGKILWKFPECFIWKPQQDLGGDSSRGRQAAMATHMRRISLQFQPLTSMLLWGSHQEAVQPGLGAAAAAALAMTERHSGGWTLTMDRMQEGMVHRPSPAIRPEAAAGTCSAILVL